MRSNTRASTGLISSSPWSLRAPDSAMVVAVEILGDHQVGDPVERLVVEEERAQQRLLRLDGMRRGLERKDVFLRYGGGGRGLQHGHVLVGLQRVQRSERGPHHR